MCVCVREREKERVREQVCACASAGLLMGVHKGMRMCLSVPMYSFPYHITPEFVIRLHHQRGGAERTYCSFLDSARPAQTEDSQHGHASGCVIDTAGAPIHAPTKFVIQK